MLKKLLKYDLGTIFRLWWIAALVSVGMSVLGGFALNLNVNHPDAPEAILTAASIFLFFTYFIIAGFVLMTQILIFIRYYRNFFTDEGYLTFTLPAKRETLLNSKVLAGLISMVATGGVCVLDFGIIFSIVQHEVIQSGEFSREVAEFFREIPRDVAGYLLVYSLEALVIIGLLILLSVLFLYCCITFGSMIVKKAKLIAAIGIYYGANSFFSTAIQLMLILGGGSIALWLEPLPETKIPIVVALIFLLIILFLAVFCALVYAFTHWMLGRKLNLS